MFGQKKEPKQDAVQHKCKCGNVKFRLIGELWFRSGGPGMEHEAWQFECIVCDNVYDRYGILVSTSTQHSNRHESCTASYMGRE